MRGKPFAKGFPRLYSLHPVSIPCGGILIKFSVGLRLTQIKRPFVKRFILLALYQHLGSLLSEIHTNYIVIRFLFQNTTSPSLHNTLCIHRINYLLKAGNICARYVITVKVIFLRCRINTVKNTDHDIFELLIDLFK